MRDDGIRPGSRTCFAVMLLLALVTPACQSAMSIEEAKKVTAPFGSASFVPPPRTINDVTAVLDQQKRTDPGTALRDQADEVPPSTTDRDALVQFYFKRGLAARDIGRARQEIEDLTKASSYARSEGSPPLYEILYHLSLAEMKGGNFSRAVEHRRKARDVVPGSSPSWLFKANALLASTSALLGDLKEAEAALAEATPFAYQALRSTDPAGASWITGLLSSSEALVRDAAGKHAEAEALYRKALAVVASHPIYGQPPHTWLDDLHSFLARNLVRQGRLVEAESEARRALVGALAKRGRYSPHTAGTLRGLVLVLLEQGRYRDSEMLARAAIDIYEKTGSAPDSLVFAAAREHLALALASQGRHAEALTEYDAIRAGLGSDPTALERLLGANTGYAEVLLKTGHADRALELLAVALDKSSRLHGRAHRTTAEIRGVLAKAYAARGDTVQAFREFREATPLLMARSPDVDDEAAGTLASDQRLVGTLTSYISLLTDIRGTPLEREAGVDATAEAFRLADVARGRSVQCAVSASAVRAVTQNPALADLVRREQDGRKQVHALYRLLADGLSRPADQQAARVLEDLSVDLPAESGAIFANYRQVPWLIRTHAVTMLPSVASLATLRALSAADPNRRPFVGFGDPYFSQEQAAARSAPRSHALSSRGPSSDRALGLLARACRLPV